MSAHRALRIALLVPRLPWPLDTGGKIRTFYLARALARSHQLRLLGFASGDSPADDAEGRRQLESLGIRCELLPPPSPWWSPVRIGQGLLGPLPVSVRKYQHRRLLRRLKQLARSGEIDLVHCDHLHMGTYGPRSGRPFVIDEHNLESAIWERLARDRSQPLGRRLLFAEQAFWMRRLELDLCRRASLVLVCSSVDQQALHRLAGGNPPLTRLVPNGVDIEYFAAPGPSEGQGHLVFTGSMDWAPNENAVLTFLDQTWPLLRQRPGLDRFLVVGRNPSARLRARAVPGQVVVTGTVPDVRPYLRGALALVVPMRVGGGTRLKILEAFAAGVPVISSAIGIEGIEARPGQHYLPAESSEAMVAAAERLRDEPELRQRLVQAARALATQRYSWDALGAELAEHYAADPRLSRADRQAASP